MNNKEKSTPKAKLNQGFASMFPSVKEFGVMGETVKSKVLRFADYAKLQEMFEDWHFADPTEIASFLNANFFVAYPAVIWLSIKDHTTREDDNGEQIKVFEDLETVQEAVGFDNWQEWTPIITHATGVVFNSDDDGETPVAETPEDAAPKNV